MPRGEHSFLHTDDGDECALDEERITITRRQFNVLCDLAARGLKRDNEGGCSSSSDGDLGWDALKNVIVGFGDIERAEYGYADRAESDAELQLVLRTKIENAGDGGHPSPAAALSPSEHKDIVDVLQSVAPALTLAGRLLAQVTLTNSMAQRE